MGKEHIQNRVLSIIWYFKVFVALFIAVGGMFFLSNKVFVLRDNKLREGVNVSTPIAIDSNNVDCQADAQTYKRIEPPDGNILIGFHLNWEVTLPITLSGQIGRNPAIINAFLDLDDDNNNPNPFDINMMAWQASEIQKVNGIYGLTMQPNANLANIRQSTLDSLAEQCLIINQKGIPILLRWGHEMNGDWASYGLKPKEYKQSFQNIANTIRRYTNLTAMVWAPNVGINYPFQGGGQAYPANGTENFKLLDTNGDGKLDTLDDPYMPYFPGAEYVDWFGISIYWYPDELQNGPPWPTYFQDNLTGRGPSIERMNNQALLDGGLRDFYGRFPKAFNKPLIMPETAAPWYTSPRAQNTETEFNIKQQWWRQIFNQDTYQNFPHLKAVVQFEEIKADGMGQERDFRVLQQPAIRDAFRTDIGSVKTLLWAQNLTYGCGGQSTAALKRFNIENNIKQVPNDDQFYFKHDKNLQREIVNSAPWRQDPNYFTKIHISAIALVKMVMHARSGGDIEVMGSLQGRVVGKEMIVMDAFALPVEGTETRVSAQNEGYEYMSMYMNQSEQVGRLENAIGWYHSHPGYGCWLSGIDVGTQTLNQQYSEPFVAIVIDPKRTISSGKVEIGAFRTYPPDYKPALETSSEYQSIPLDKIEDFGVHAKSYYQLEIVFFKSELDQDLLEALWKRYWINTLSSSPLVSNWGYLSGQMNDLAKKIDNASGSFGPMSFDRRIDFSKGNVIFDPDPDTASAKEKGGPLAGIVQDSSKLSSEANHGLLSQVVKDMVFNKTCLK